MPPGPPCAPTKLPMSPQPPVFSIAPLGSPYSPQTPMPPLPRRYSHTIPQIHRFPLSPISPIAHHASPRPSLNSPCPSDPSLHPLYFLTCLLLIWVPLDSSIPPHSSPYPSQTPSFPQYPLCSLPIYLPVPLLPSYSYTPRRSPRLSIHPPPPYLPLWPPAPHAHLGAVAGAPGGCSVAVGHRVPVGVVGRGGGWHCEWSHSALTHPTAQRPHSVACGGTVVLRWGLGEGPKPFIPIP